MKKDFMDSCAGHTTVIGFKSNCCMLSDGHHDLEEKE